jgi:hypothetical protein
MMRSILYQDEIKEGVDELHRKVDTCIDACQVLLLSVILSLF